MSKDEHLGLPIEKLIAIAKDEYAIASDEVTDNWNTHLKSEEFHNIVAFNPPLGKLLPAESVFFDRLENRAVLIAVAKMIDANNARLAQQLSGLIPPATDNSGS